MATNNILFFLLQIFSNAPELIETTIFPNVCENLEHQYVCVTLQVIPSAGYPDVQPKYQLKNPRGLDDLNVIDINKAIDKKLQESIGSPVVFDLINIVRDHLTDSNLPSGQCVICLYGFQDGDAFIKTVCYHYFHSYCFARHLTASERNYQEELDKLPSWQKNTFAPFEVNIPILYFFNEFYYFFNFT